MERVFFAQWKPSYSVGNSMLDDQHKKLLGLCAKAVSCMSDDSREGVSQFHDILNDLADYVEKHFRTEEAVLRECGYPLLERHREEHLEYQVKLTDFLVSATRGEINKAALHNYLSHWWSDHILCSDRQYAGSIKVLN